MDKQQTPDADKGELVGDGRLIECASLSAWRGKSHCLQFLSSIAADKAFWTVFYANGDQSMIHDLGGNRMGITVGPWKESVGAQSEFVIQDGAFACLSPD